jgi:hypothetical protein
VPAIKRYLNYTVPNIDDEEDDNSNNGYDSDCHPGVDDSSQLEPSPPSFITDETDHTYQTHYAEILYIFALLSFVLQPKNIV